VTGTENKKTIGNICDRKSASFFLTNGFFRSCYDYRFYRNLGVATAAGAEAKAEAPGSVIDEDF
jgi:hypothetical protein